MKKKKTQNDFNYQNAFNKEHYDRININAKKGTREIIEAAATQAGMKMSPFVLQAVYEKIERENENEQEIEL